MWLQLYNYKIYINLIIGGLGYNGFYNKITNKFILIQVKIWVHMKSENLMIIKS